MPTFEAMKAGYKNLWKSAKVRPDCVEKVMPAVHRILKDKERYEAVEAMTGVPWFWIACAHDRESSGNFKGVLHNGQQIIGTGRKTTLVPAGRGPFDTWEEAAVDALALKGLSSIKEWTVERMLFEWERFNGFGYVKHGVNSPYVWADTNHEQSGKYVRDGVFDPNADDKQRGCAAVLLMLSEHDEEIKKRITGRAGVVTPAAGGTIAAGGTAAAAEAAGLDPIMVVILALIAAAAVAAAIYFIRRKS
jgi:lysozyme family protein